MKIAFITNVPTSIGRIRLQEEAEARGHSFTILSWKSVIITEPFFSEIVEQLSAYDVVHFAGGFGEYMTQEFQERLEKLGVFCPNSYTRRSLNADNKVYQSIQFAKSSIPVPLTVRSTRPSFEEISSMLGAPFVAKKPNSTQGKGVALIYTAEELAIFCERKKEYLFQECISYTADYRVHVVGGKSFCAYRRVASPGEFRANVSLGAHLEIITDTELMGRLSDLSIATAAAMHLDYCGVDILEDNTGTFSVLETNSDPGFKEVEEITGESFAVPIMDFYEQSLKTLRSS